MDLGADECVFGEEPDPTQVEHPIWRPGSPMQQSPDQSNINDKYKSPEITDPDVQEDRMDTTDEKPESPAANMEGEEVNENEISGSITQEDKDIAGVAAEHEDSHVAESSEHVCCTFKSAMTPVEMDEQDDEIDSSGEINKEIEVMDILGRGAEVYNSNVVSSDNECDSNVDSTNIDEYENEAANEPETEAADNVESEALQGDCHAKSDSPEPLSSEEEAKDDNTVSAENESEDDKPIDDVYELDTGAHQISSNVDNISGSDRIKDHSEYESIKEWSQAAGSPEVSSTSLDKAVQGDTIVSESRQKAQENDLQFSRQIDSVRSETEQGLSCCTQEIYSFKYPNSGNFAQRGSDVTNVGSVQKSSNIEEKGSLDSSELDNLSTLSVRSSSNRNSGDDDDDDDDNLDLTEGSEETESVHLSQREIAERRTHSDIHTHMAAQKVIISTNVEEDLLQREKAKTVEEFIDRNTEVEEGEIDSASMDKQDEDKQSEASLEEVSDEEEDGELAVGERGSISGMEEVSSEEDDEPDYKKEESGMEEISDEEEESGEETVAVNGVEDISSEEEEIETDLKKVEEVRVRYTRTVQVKQSKSKEVVQIDDTGKEDGAIVKEILENITIQIEHNKIENKTDAVARRRKSKDKKERRESVKFRLTSSSVKDTRDINERLKAQACYGDDVELDYDDTVHDESKDKQVSESDGEITSDTSSSDGELEEEECEEGEIKEPGQKPYIKPTCRFFMRGHCTWGINCRFLHPGVNDKGYYQLIERPGFNNKPPPPFEEKWEEEEEIERTPSPEPPPPAPEPKEETAWERGLRQAKELRKKAIERREMETNFEHKKMNLSIEENPEYDKENTVEEVVIVEKSPKKSPVKKQPYYDKYEPLSDDEYYDQTPVRLQQKQMEQSWMHGQYENFEVNWTQDQYGIPPRGPYPPPRYHYPPDHHALRGRDRIALRSSPRRFSQSPPPMQRQRQMRPPQHEPQDMVRREKIRDMSPPSQKYPPASGRGRGRGRGRPKADDWNDPWTRANANKPKSPKKRSRSRGRRRSRRSYSYSSSYSTSSYSGSSRSRSRSSSYSSVSSHSSRSSSNSRSRSPATRSVPRHGMRHPVPAGNQQNQPMRRPSVQTRPAEPPKSSVTAQVRPGKVPERRPSGVSNSRSGANPLSATKPIKGPAPPPGRQPPSLGQPPNRGPPSRQPPNRQPSPRQPPSKIMGQQIADVGHGRKPPQKAAAAPPPQSQRKFQMAVKTRDRPLPQSALSKEKTKGKPIPRKRKASSSSSRSRSRSRSSSSSSRSSYSTRSSRSYSRSRSSSSSSSGSADSDHLYRNIGARENQRAVPVGRGKPDPAKHGRLPAAGRVVPGKQGLKPTIGETSRPSSVAQAKVVKDPLKMTGLKSNIKLTLIKQSEKPPPGSVPDAMSRKRPSEPILDAPPMKRPAIPNPPKIDKPVKKSEKVVPVSPVKAPARPPGPVKPILGAPGVATATLKKKSTVSRREELLKQLKAVEDAIAKKKKKMG